MLHHEEFSIPRLQKAWNLDYGNKSAINAMT